MFAVRRQRPFRAILLAGCAVAVSLLAGGEARANLRRDAQTCANQSIEAARDRINACERIIKSGRLRGEPRGVAYALRGLALLDTGDFAHAIGDLNQAIAFAPSFAPAYQNRGNAWYARGNFGAALADYDRAIQLDPDSASPYVNRAILRRDLGNAKGAMEDFQKAIEISPNRASAYSARGELYMHERDYARAIADYDRAVKLAPTPKHYMLRAL